MNDKCYTHHQGKHTPKSNLLAELRASEARYRAIVEEQIDLVIRYTPDRRLTFVNESVCQVVGKPPQALLAHDLLEYTHPDERERVKSHIAELSPQNPVSVIEQRHIGADGTEYWHRWVDKVLLDEQGQMVEIQGVGHDITDKKAKEDELRAALDREAQLNILHSQFLSMAAHDLRNPIAAIRTAIALLLDYHDRLTSKRKQQKLQQIDDLAVKMSRSLEDVLLIGRSVTGHLRFQPEPVEVMTFCQEMIDEVELAYNNSNPIHLVQQKDFDVLDLDPKLLRYILTNLLSNAVKYSPGGTHITLVVRGTDEQIEFIVIDQGIGIPKAEQEHVFELFQRFSNVGAIPGTGLGLAIVRQCVELHGGYITFSSANGKGTTFRVLIPT